MSAGDTDPAAIKPVPAPWTVKAEAWWFITSLGHRTEQGETLPISYFPTQETQLYKISMEQGAFRGGRGSITLIRYSESPVGPFEELAIAPGEFANPYQKPSHRVTRAYVSSMKALVSGRHNWGLPRELAQFSFTPSLEYPDATEVRIFPAISPTEFAPEACFAALIKPVSWLPAIPTNLSHFSRVTLCQPPLEATSDSAAPGLVAIPRWHLLDCSESSGRAKPFRCEGLLPPQEEAPNPDPQAPKTATTKRMADGVAFPDVEPYSIGIHWTEMSMTLPLAVPLATL
ncbi:hypothetical protein BC628DRAFT_1397743 [Trametes gibbosa]|nr:hypothetical protein BC628DRAFT_1397743 [Trametes gibbosa]